jgi:hypothetical protein
VSKSAQVFSGTAWQADAVHGSTGQNGEAAGNPTQLEIITELHRADRAQHSRRGIDGITHQDSESPIL